ncbi:MAG: hypothetical protein JWO77_3556 [Ilumatobacteraceae bacterium]|nr:hypothetical protein [Ilumatobacteraceae bacterium]
MDAFEDLTARLLWREGYWTRQSYKVDITKADKASLANPYMPRPEIDIVGYRPATDTVVWVECKSYLDSDGVHISAFDGTNEKFAKRFRVFTNPTFRSVVSERLLEQLLEDGLIRPTAKLRYWLVAGRIAGACQESVPAHFAANGWTLRDRAWIRTSLQAIAKEGYEDDVVTMAAKMLGD